MTTPEQGFASQVEGKPGSIDYARLRAVLDEQEGLFLRLDALSKEQGRLVREEASDALLRLLGERQRVVTALERSSVELQPFRARWDEVLGGASPEQRERFARQLGTLSEVAASVASRDDADRGVIEARRDRIAGELAGVGNVRGAVAAYGQPAGRPNPKFQDREG